MTTTDQITTTNALVERLTGPIRGEAVEPKELVLPESGVMNPLEEWAREEAESQFLDLALTLPVGLVMTSLSCHGATYVQTPHFRTSTTVQHIGLAGSGIGKTTLLGNSHEVLDGALKASQAEMAAWVADRLAFAATLPGQDMPAWEKVYRAGLCSEGMLLDSTTMEGLRNALSKNGSHQGIWTAESDVIDEIGRYQNSKDAGSISMFLHGYDGVNIRVRRAGAGLIAANVVSVPMVLLLQPAVFEDITNPYFITKGFFHRTFITRSNSLLNADDADDHWMDETAAPGLEVLSSALEKARLRFSDRLTRLSRATAVHAATKAAWEMWRSEGMTTSGVAEPVVTPMRRLVLAGDPGTMRAYRRMQWVRRAVNRAVDSEEAVNPGSVEAMWKPMTMRLSSHVLRIAANYRLAMEPDAVEVRGGDIDDAMDRVLPWLWDHWSACMSSRNVAVLQDSMLKGLKDNPKGLTVSAEGLIMRATGLMMRDAYPDFGKKDWPGGVDVTSFSQSAVIRRARDLLNGDAKRIMEPVLREAMSRMVAVGEFLELTPGSESKKYKQVRLTRDGLRHAAAQIR